MHLIHKLIDALIVIENFVCHSLGLTRKSCFSFWFILDPNENKFDLKKDAILISLLSLSLLSLDQSLRDA